MVKRKSKCDDDFYNKLTKTNMALFHKLLVACLPLVPKPIIYLFSNRYIAGSTLEDAVRVIAILNKRGAMATIDILGEEITIKSEAQQVVEKYIEVLKIIDQRKLNSNISIKPTHVGLKLDKEFCYFNVRRIVEAAASLNNFVRIDMEDYTCTSDTIEIYLRLKAEFQNVGTVIQSYLRRTIDDVTALVPDKSNLRLCKGIYIEPYEVAYKDGEIINKNFCYCLEKLLRNHCYVGIGTHDERLVWYALSLINQLKLQRDEYEFQMLLGVTEDLRDIIIKAGHRLRVYVPFGESWYAYSLRRLKENPSIAGYVLKNLFKRRR
jgi:proline dehydrogenase